MFYTVLKEFRLAGMGGAIMKDDDRQRTGEPGKEGLLQRIGALRKDVAELVEKIDSAEDLERIRRFVAYIYIRK